MDNTVELKTIRVVCPNCGAELISSSKNLMIKCHWCHTNVSTDTAMDNPRVPDRILPFKLSKEEAIKNVNEYFNDRKKCAKKEFIDSFNPNEIIPVYMPYMLVDVNVHSKVYGLGERYNNPDDFGKHGSRLISVFDVRREFDLYIEDLLVESSDSSYFSNVNATSNVISAVSPFDTSNCVEFNVNFLNGYSMENRELDVIELKTKIPSIVDSISKSEYAKFDNEYDRGIRWDEPKSKIIGSQWTSALLPIWLYSYYEKETGRKYYIAVNGRTGKVVGSIPTTTKQLKRQALKNIILKPFMLIMILITLGIIIYSGIIYLPVLIDYFQNSGDLSNIGGSFITVSISLLFFFLFIFLKSYFDFYVAFDDEREKYTSTLKKIDYEKESHYSTNNTINNDRKIDEYKTSRKGKKDSNTTGTVIAITN
jgi:hypothetical protein